MLAHRLRMIAFAAIAMGLATVASTHADVETSRTQYLTFTRPVALPGVTLKSGTYIFELADPDAAPDVVRVLSRDRKDRVSDGVHDVDRSARGRPAQSARVAARGRAGSGNAHHRVVVRCADGTSVRLHRSRVVTASNTRVRRQGVAVL